MNIDIGSLDDDQLFEMLKKNGVEVGPIVASTRKFYEKKLSAALAGETATASNGTNGTKEFSDTEPEDEEEEQPAVVEVVAKRRTPRFIPLFYTRMLIICILSHNQCSFFTDLSSRAPALLWNQDSASALPWLMSSTPHLPVLAPGGQSTAIRSLRPLGR